MIALICHELKIQKDFLGDENIETIYFGGGSPSLLTEAELYSILQTVHDHFSIISQPEITLEGNPDDLTYDYLTVIKKLGINRLSIGIQSFDPKNLAFLNRVHSARQSFDCLENSLKAGFDNFSIDLIYGIPNADQFSWEKDLEVAVEIKPKHISAYCLTIEEKTVFGNWYKKGKLAAIDEELAALQYEMLVEKLETFHYHHYEISNFAQEGYYSQHNSSYWKNKKYLGVGPGAHSYNGKCRLYNVENNEKYIACLSNNQLSSTSETLSLENKINEYILTSLRTIWGCDNQFLKEEYNYDLIKNNIALINRLVQEQYLIKKDHTLFLTKTGKLMADKITEELWVTF